MQTERAMDAFDVNWVAELGLMELRWPKARTEVRPARPSSAGDAVGPQHPRTNGTRDNVDAGGIDERQPKIKHARRVNVA